MGPFKSKQALKFTVHCENLLGFSQRVSVRTCRFWYWNQRAYASESMRTKLSSHKKAFKNLYENWFLPAFLLRFLSLGQFYLIWQNWRGFCAKIISFGWKLAKLSRKNIFSHKICSHFFKVLTNFGTYNLRGNTGSRQIWDLVHHFLLGDISWVLAYLIDGVSVGYDHRVSLCTTYYYWQDAVLVRWLNTISWVQAYLIDGVSVG